MKLTVLIAGNRFRPTKARDVIAAVLRSRLAGATYNADKMSALSREIADEIKQRLKGMCAAALPASPATRP